MAWNNFNKKSRPNARKVSRFIRDRNKNLDDNWKSFSEKNNRDD